MKILSILATDKVKDSLSQLCSSETKVIGVGVLMPNSEVKVVVIDVTNEVRKGYLEANNLPLVNSFIHSYQEEILTLVEEFSTPLALHAAC